MRRIAGEKTPRRMTLGRYPALGLAEARKRARALLETLVDMGIDDADVARLMADFEAELVASRTATMAKIGRCIEEPDAPSHELQ